MQAPYRQVAADAQELKDLLQKATSIVETRRNVETFLHRNREHVRDFFKVAFPVLLRKVFGFEDSLVSVRGPYSSVATSAGGWLAAASRPGGEAEANALVGLLAPGSVLFQALIATDSEGQVRFVFPSERLPSFLRRLLGSQQGALLLCQMAPFYRGRIIQESSGALQVQLSLFEYYIFWFMYYIVCKDVSSRSVKRVSPAVIGGLPSRAQIRSQFESWKSALPGLHGQGQASKPSPYRELLSAYLQAFHPSEALGSSHMAGLPPATPAAAGAPGTAYGGVLLNAAVEFWLMGDDLFPVACGSPEVCLLLQQLGNSALGMVYVPPTDDLIESLFILIRSIVLNEHPLPGLAEAPEQSARSPGGRTPSFYETASWRDPLLGAPGREWQGGARLRLTPPPAARGAMATLQRPLFRFFMRAFANWPLDSSASQISKLVDLWVAFLEPWNMSASLPLPIGFPLAKRLWSRQGPGGSPGGGAGVPTGTLSSDQQGPLRSALGSTAPLGQKPPGSGVKVYCDSWRGYVMENYPFYDTLLSAFLQFELRASQLDAEASLQLISKVLAVYDSSPALLDLLRRGQVAYNRCLHGGTALAQGSSASSLTEWVPIILSHLREWKDPSWTTPGRTDGAFSEQQPVPELLLFSSDEGGVPRMVQALLARLEAQLQPPHGRPAGPSRAVESLKVTWQAAARVFGLTSLRHLDSGGQCSLTAGEIPEAALGGIASMGDMLRASHSSPSLWSGAVQGSLLEETPLPPFRQWQSPGGSDSSGGLLRRGSSGRFRTGAFPSEAGGNLQQAESSTPGGPSGRPRDRTPYELKQHTWRDVKYKGDWMYRPVEAGEVAFLVRALVDLSDSVNRALGLGLLAPMPALPGGSPDQEGNGGEGGGEGGRDRDRGCGAGDPTLARGRGAAPDDKEATLGGSGGGPQGAILHAAEGEEGRGAGTDGSGSQRQNPESSPQCEQDSGVGGQSNIPASLVGREIRNVTGSTLLAGLKTGISTIADVAKVGPRAAAVGKGFLDVARRRGWRINLRFLADIRVLALLVLLLLFRKVLGTIGTGIGF